jgi:hypothetical protein
MAKSNLGCYYSVRATPDLVRAPSIQCDDYYSVRATPDFVRAPSIQCDDSTLG